MEGRNYMSLVSEKARPVFNFARLKRHATVEDRDKPDPTVEGNMTKTSSSMSEINKSTINNFLNNKNNNNKSKFGDGSPNSSVTSLSSPNSGSKKDFMSSPITEKPRGTKKFERAHSRPTFNSPSDDSGSNSPADSMPFSFGKHCIRPFQACTNTPGRLYNDDYDTDEQTGTVGSPKDSSPSDTPPRPRPLTKTPPSALSITPTPKEKPVFRRYLSLIVFPSSLKQIPFTVPTSPHSTGTRSAGFRKTEQRSLDDGSTTSGISEPASPTSALGASGVKRPSVEIPGAYALGSIDPSLYKVADEDDHYDIPADHIGRIWFATEYERETEKLMVTLIKAKNLPSRTQGHDNACDPFVRLYLMPDERRYLQSKFRKKTCNPKFEETYVFQVSHRALQDRVLKLTVYDVDRHKRHQVIGHALYPLREHDCENNVRLVFWRDLEREVSESTTNKGDMHVSVCYNNHLERLTVGLFESKELHITSPVGHQMDTYAKVCLMSQNKPIKMKKTEIVKKSSCPNFNESFTFKVPVTSLDTASVNIYVMQHVSGHKDRQIGRVVLGSFMFARGKELDHWNEMMANQKEQISHWHTLS